ncbi:succinic semialdehyde dehydrogenase [Jongsikchunia kroppenstedtii]|uniref:succinic semialdehyde dehydrogenase n=1 Tax=Jongsikchunia kroppenstedtii TaxID=1121721 RepID=UPI00037AFDBD|nr:succinic semialdehyde dehydrogenase [Jongsikchunia kroppenstedtii]
MPKPSAAVFDRLRALAAIDDPSARESRPVLEAFSGTEMTTIPVGTADDVKVAFERARAAQSEWARVWPKERAAILLRFADLVYRHRNELIDVVQAETGKARHYAQEEVLDVAMTARHYAKAGPKLLSAKRVPGMMPVATDTRVRYQPKGVVGIISPWNYPITLTVSDAVPALMAGNAVVLKPDSQTPYSALVAAELLYQAGLPKHLYAVVPGPGSVVGQEILANADYLMFTGSSATGASLAEKAGKRLIGFSAELGGKNPMIVTKTADIDKAVEGAARGAYSNSGQLCISIERIYVEQPVAAEFTEKFAKRVQNMVLGNTYDFTPEMGSLASAAQVETVQAHVDDAVAKGATVLAGGKRREDLGPFFFEPTVLSNVSEEMDCYANETFGPLVSIYPVADAAEAIARANDTEYGLNASIFAKNSAEARRIAAEVRSGTVNINEGYGAAWGSTAAPMGGMGISGVGRRHGSEGLLKYTESQTIAAQRGLGLAGSPLLPFLPRRLYVRLVPYVVRLVRVFPGR